jgi:hypothetical protein
MKIELSEQIFEKYSNVKFYENPSSGSRVVPCGRTDSHDECNSRYLKFYERAKPICTININRYVYKADPSGSVV